MGRKKAEESEEAESTALVPYDEEFAQLAEQFATQEANVGGGGLKFSTKGGVLSLNGNAIPGNHVPVIVLDSVLLNTFYKTKYNDDQVTSPACYAIGRSEETLAPDVTQVGEPQAEGCAACPNNEYGSSDTGEGKACSNRRRLAVIAAGEFDAEGGFVLNDDPDYYANGEVAYVELAPTALKGFASWVKQLAASKRPPLAVVAEMRLVQVPGKAFFTLQFATIEPVPAELVPAVIARYKQERELISFPYPKYEDKPAPPQRRTNAAPQRKPSQGAVTARQQSKPTVSNPPRASAPARQSPPQRTPPPQRQQPAGRQSSGAKF